MTPEEAQALLVERGWVRQQNRELHGNEKYVIAYQGDCYAELDGHFTAEELEAISIWLKRHRTRSWKDLMLL